MKNKQTIIIIAIVVVLIVALVVLLMIYEQPDYEEGEVALYSGDTLVASYTIEQFVEDFDIVEITAVLDTSSSSATNVVFSGVMLVDILEANNISATSVQAYASDGYASAYSSAQLEFLAVVYMLDGQNLTSDGDFKGPFAIIDTSSMYSQYWCQCVVTIIV